MVTVYGMSDEIGPICLKSNDPYERQVFGDNIDDRVGEEVKRLIDSAYKTAQYFSEYASHIYPVSEKA